VRSFIAFLGLGSAMAAAQNGVGTHITPIQNHLSLRQDSTGSYYGLIGLMCLLGLAVLGGKARTSESAATPVGRGDYVHSLGAVRENGTHQKSGTRTPDADTIIALDQASQTALAEEATFLQDGNHGSLAALGDDS
jgi:hypothetical protein